MGGCVASCMSTIDSSKRVENKHITAIKQMGPQTAEIGDNEGRPESKIRRSKSMTDLSYPDLCAKFLPNGSLVPNIRAQALKNGNKKAMAYRKIVKEEKETIKDDKGKEKPWTFLHLDEAKYITYREMWDLMVNFGNGLRKYGLNAGDKIGIYEDTRWEWLVSCYGIWTQAMVGVTVYANLGEDALIYAVRESEMNAIILAKKQVAKLVKLCNDAGIPVPKLIVLDGAAEIEDSSVEKKEWTEIVEMGKGEPEPTELPANPEDLALIMYTSGTTGDPKGVLIAHGNALAAVTGLSKRLEDFLGGSGEDETYVGYLPLAHILEFTAENIMLMRGAMIGYGNPRTLTDTSARPHGDLKEYKPTFFAGVPRIYDTIKKAVEGKLPPVGETKRTVFDRAYQERKEALKKGQETPYFNAKVFENPRQLLGGRCKMLISGGAPLSAATYEFLTVVFGCAVGQGYGLTETSAACSIQRYYDLQPENVGGLLSCIEVKLRDADIWKHTDPEPRGEILIRGPTITKGYYKQPEKTAEVYIEDGWFCTGDVGQIAPDGTLKIIGRVKALAKNAHGEYIAMEALESTYVVNELCMPNGVCILVDPHKSAIAVLVLTDEAKTKAFCAANQIECNYPDVLNTPEFRKKAIASLQKTATEAGRKPFELVKAARILNEEWTPENGILTAAQKLKRREIDSKYKDTIEEMFKEIDN